MKIEPNPFLARYFKTEDIEYTDLSALGGPGDYIFRCKAELKRKYVRNEPHLIQLRVGYCFGRTLAELERNCIEEITAAFERKHESSNATTYADLMYM